MSGYLLSTFVAAMMFAMQAAPPPAAATQKDTKKVTLTGCITRDVSTPDSYTFSDVRTGAKYRLSAIDMRKTAGRHQELVVGIGGWRVTIRGGLVPSANVAAQAGAMDPAQVAIASMPGGTNSGTGNIQLPEFRVTGLRSLSGRCP